MEPLLVLAGESKVSFFMLALDPRILNRVFFLWRSGSDLLGLNLLTEPPLSLEDTRRIAAVFMEVTLSLEDIGRLLGPEEEENTDALSELPCIELCTEPFMELCTEPCMEPCIEDLGTLLT